MQNNNKPTLGFIGLGIMGLPMATNLLRAGYEVVAYARKQEIMDQFKALGGDCEISPYEVGKRVDILVTIVTDSPQVKEVLFAQNGAAKGLKAGSLVIDMSTISPVKSLEIANQLAELNIRMLDAPVSGGDIGAKAGSLSIMVGGESEDVAEALPIFEVLGKQIVHIGGKSAGQVCKSCNQMMIAQALNTVSETLHYAKKMGVDAYKVRDALLGGFAGSRVLEVHGLKMLEENFQPGFKCDLHLKDMKIVEEALKHCHIQSMATELATAKIAQAVHQGKGELDNSAIHLITQQALK